MINQSQKKNIEEQNEDNNNPAPENNSLPHSWNDDKK